MLVVAPPGNSKALDANTALRLNATSWHEGWSRLAFIMASGLGFLALALQLGSSAYMAGRIMPGVSVAGMQIGGMTRAEAEKVLTRPLEHRSLALVVGTTSYRVSLSDIGASYDPEATLNQAMRVGRTQPFVPLQLLGALKSQTISYSV